MAIMLPDTPRECTKNSLEELMFNSLKQLSDDYYVFHSFTIVRVDDNTIRESETDFVIFNPEKGILCLEAKAGSIRYENEEWYYGSGVKMRHGGPYLQAQSNKYKLMEYLIDKGLDDIVNNCKFTHGVWFPSISESNLRNISFPSDGDKLITLTSEALNDPQSYIERIYSYTVNSKYERETNLEAYQIKQLLNNVLCPKFNLVPSIKNKIEHNRTAFNRLLREQEKILDFLEDQKYAAISGVAGSGKTMIAVEKARRCSILNERVLFLCYNRFLCEYLRENYKYDAVEFYTIDGFACKICNTNEADLKLLSQKIEEMYYDNVFPYKHVIIDEGQDFGQNHIEESNIVDLLQMIVLDEAINGSFYIFYDKMQLVQGKSIPHCIIDADCRMTLYINCRNTENIAITSVRPLNEEKRQRIREGAIKGDSPVIYIETDREIIKKCINHTLTEYKRMGVSDIVFLTCKTEKQSILAEYIKDGCYIYEGKSYKFTSCKKFKGLEADVIILLDIDKRTLLSEEVNLFYVGASRARFSLTMIAELDDNDCNEVLVTHGKNKNKRAKKALSAFLNARFIDISTETDE